MDLATIEAENEAGLVSFFKPFFENEGKTLSFIQWIYSFDWNNRIPRQMINQIYRFVTLASRIDQIWPVRDGLRIVFIKTCLESLFHLSCLDKKEKKQFYSVFANCFSDEGKNCILSRFRLLSYTDYINGVLFDNSYSLTISDYLEIIKFVRDRVVHDGEYWEIQLFAYGDDPEVNWLTSFSTTEKLLANRTLPNHGRNTDYHFETSLYYEDFRFYFVEACINYVKAYINRLPICDNPSSLGQSNRSL
ncbi:MAG: hypothetical protein IJR17_03015 [Clostridia bacterium]|nr:hypothetical protein [Clostridia bacterium]